jgi:RNA polymerase sigma-70 factor (ECF subfamily)
MHMAGESATGCESLRRAQAAELMTRYCDGDPGAFGALYTLLEHRVRSFLMVRVDSRFTAEDLLQQTFLNAHLARGVFARGADPLPWLLTIARRLLIDETRRRQRTRRALTCFAGACAGQEASSPGTVEAEEHEKARLCRAAREALGQLPENQRRAVTLTKIEGHGVAAAAAILGTTSGAVKLRAHRAYVALRSRLEAPDCTHG